MLPVLEHFAATLDNKSSMWPESAAAAVVQVPIFPSRKKAISAGCESSKVQRMEFSESFSTVEPVFEREQLVVVTPGRIICVRAYPFKQSVFQFLLIPDACSGPLTPFEEQKWMHSVPPGKSVHHSAGLGRGTSEVSIAVASCGYSRWDYLDLLSMIFVSCFRFKKVAWHILSHACHLNHRSLRRF